jgi:hypothetical protein
MNKSIIHDWKHALGIQTSIYKSTPNERIIYINSLPFPFKTLAYGAISPDISGYLNLNENLVCFKGQSF